MDKTALFYFSGTGNTKLVCEALARALADHGNECVLIPIEQQLRESTAPDITEYSMIGIAHPVHAWDAPRIVHDFVKRLPRGDHTRSFFLKTAGGYSPSNFGASHSLIRRMTAGGYDVFYDRLFCMPSNWLVGTAEATARRLYLAAQEKAVHMASELTAGVMRSLPMGAFTKALFSAAYVMEDMGAKIMGKDLRADEKCTNCGWCVRQCPVGNITGKAGTVHFGWHCMMCMRCVYGCPHDAINYRLLSRLKVKSWCGPRRLQDDTLEPAVLDGTTTGYDKQYVAYVHDVSR